MTVSEYKNAVKGKRIDVIGLGVSNMPLIDFLLSAGAFVTARDKKPYDEAKEKYDELRKKGVRVICGDEYLSSLNGEIIFRSPGIRHTEEHIAKAVSSGAYLTSEMELFFELCPCNMIAITGSDGKTTTTTLVSEILKSDGKRVFLGGNIGAPLLPRVEEMKKDDYAVIELSSFQLQTMTRSPQRCVVTNVSPNHLNWHTDMDEYTNAKKNIFIHQDSTGLLVTNAVCPITANMAGNGKTVYFSSGEKPSSPCGIYIKDGCITQYDESSERSIVRLDEIMIPGRHNAENYMAAIGVLSGLVSDESIRSVARTFGGVAHRCEFVRQLDGVKYYNSSIDSSPTRTMAALSCFDKGVIVILGGYDKNIPYEPLVKPLFDKAEAVVLTGANAEKIYSAIVSHPEYTPDKIKIYRESEFIPAVEKCRSIAKEGNTVLLSPAAASFDAFDNFEHRGNTFKKIVNDFK